MVLYVGMKSILIPIDQAGRIVLPKDVREELAIKPGDTLKVSIHGSCSVILTLNKEKPGFVRKSKALVFSSQGDEMLNHETLEQILEHERDEREMGATSGMMGRNRR